MWIKWNRRKDKKQLYIYVKNCEETPNTPSGGHYDFDEDILYDVIWKNKEGDNAILIVTAGDAKIDNKKFKAEFGHKAKMLTPEEVMEYIGHGIGGVCPFAIRNNQVKVYLDVSMKRFNTVFPAAGSSNSSIELTCDELERFSHADKWIDVCKGYETIE